MADIRIGNDPIQRYLKAQSTHQSIQDRLSVYNKLGLNKPGFWVDWKQRTLNAQVGEEDMPTAAQNPVIKTLNPYDTQATNYTTDPPIKRDPIKPIQINITPGVGKPPGKANLQKAERELVESNLLSRLRNSPILGTSTLDAMTAEMTFMTSSLLLDMQSHPDEFLSEAMKKYYNDPNSDMWLKNNTNMTNFELEKTQISLIQKKPKNIGQFRAPSDDRKQAVQNFNVASTTGAKNMNVKMGGYYAPPLYMSPFG